MHVVATGRRDKRVAVPAQLSSTRREPKSGSMDRRSGLLFRPAEDVQRPPMSVFTALEPVEIHDHGLVIRPGPGATQVGFTFDKRLWWEAGFGVAALFKAPDYSAGRASKRRSARAALQAGLDPDPDIERTSWPRLAERHEAEKIVICEDQMTSPI